MSQATFSNRLIRCLTDEDYKALRPHLEPVPLTARQVLVQRNAIVPYIYFPEAGQTSVLAKVAGSESIEVAMIGREGMTDLVPARKAPLETIVQVAGHGHRIDHDVFVKRMSQSLDLANLVAKWQHALLILISFTALSHGGFTVVERLARYMLMLHDRLDGDDIPLVHDYFAWMLAVRRAGVTEAFSHLRSIGAIETGRGRLRVIDRTLLVEAARGSYGPAEAEYERLFGWSISRSERESDA
ncbi:MAG TPA: Crp/Fnr family transcriptional regulator [Beijerinckiaceae bacterium]